MGKRRLEQHLQVCNIVHPQECYLDVHVHNCTSYLIFFLCFYSDPILKKGLTTHNDNAKIIIYYPLQYKSLYITKPKTHLVLMYLIMFLLRMQVQAITAQNTNMMQVKIHKERAVNPCKIINIMSRFLKSKKRMRRVTATGKCQFFHLNVQENGIEIRYLHLSSC